MLAHYIFPNLSLVSHASWRYGSLEAIVTAITVLMMATMLAMTRHLAHQETRSQRQVLGRDR